jgi:ankyrin repeat protein
MSIQNDPLVFNSLLLFWESKTLPCKNHPIHSLCDRIPQLVSKIKVPSIEISKLGRVYFPKSRSKKMDVRNIPWACKPPKSKKQLTQELSHLIEHGPHEVWKINELLKSGADPNAVISDGSPLLLHAFRAIGTEIVELLIQYKADLGIKVDDEPLEMYVSVNLPAIYLETLLKHGGDSNAKTKKGEHLLFYACRLCSSEEVKKIITILLKYKSDPPLHDQKGIPLLAYACHGFPQDLLEKMLKDMANPNVKNHMGNYILAQACMDNRRDVVNLLLKYGAKTDLMLEDDTSLLHRVCRSCNEEIIKAIIENRPDSMHHLDENKWTPFIFLHYRSPKVISQNLLDKVKELDAGFSDWLKDTTLLAHRFGFNLVVKLLNQKKLKLEGFHTEIVIPELQRSFQNFQAYVEKESTYIIPKIWKKQDWIEVKHILQKTLDGSNTQPVILENSIYAFTSGWKNHSIGIVVYNDLLIKCNRGEECGNRPGIVIYKINKGSQINFQKVLSELAQNKFIDEGKKTFNTNIDLTLDLKEIHYIPHVEQHAGNCSWASAKLLLEGIIFFILLRKGKKPCGKASELSPLFGIIEKESEVLYRAWFDFDREKSIGTYLKQIKLIYAMKCTQQLKKEMTAIMEQCLIEILLKCISGKTRNSRTRIFHQILDEFPQLASGIPQFENPRKQNLLFFAYFYEDHEKIKILESLSTPKQK